MTTQISSLDALKEADRSLYSAVLYAPEAKRQALATLHLFERETARVRDLVSEPLPGEIRLQWWRDVLSGERHGEAAAHPLASNLLSVVTDYDIAAASLAAMTEARIFDLYDDPMPSLNDFEGYCGETWSSLFQVCAQVLGEGTPPDNGDAAGHAGVAYGVSLLVSRVAVHRARGQVFVPQELLSATGGDANQWLFGDDDGYRARALSAFIDIGRDHSQKAVAAIKAMPKVFKPAFMPLALTGPMFARASKWPSEVLSAPLDAQPLRDQIALMRAAFTL